MSRSRRILFVGEMPPARTARGAPHSPLYPYPEAQSGGRLCAMSGLTDMGWLRRTTRINLSQDYHERLAKGQLTEYMERLRSGGMFVTFDRVVLVGARCRDAAIRSNSCDLTRESWRPCTFSPLWNGMVAWVPHPSGRNRWYNVPGNKKQVERFLGKLFRDQGEIR